MPLSARKHHELSRAYATGKGADRDTDLAMRHLEEAARLGDPEAQHDLASETYRQNHARSLRLFLASAKGGSANGALSAGRMLWSGRHAKRDAKRGLALLEMAAKGKAKGRA